MNYVMILANFFYPQPSFCSEIWPDPPTNVPLMLVRGSGQILTVLDLLKKKLFDYFYQFCRNLTLFLMGNKWRDTCQNPLSHPREIEWD